MSPAPSETRDSREGTELRLHDVEAGFPIHVFTPCDTVLLLFIPTVVFSKPEKHFIDYLIFRMFSKHWSSQWNFIARITEIRVTETLSSPS
jgi:hypothetical protein